MKTRLYKPRGCLGFEWYEEKAARKRKNLKAKNSKRKNTKKWKVNPDGEGSRLLSVECLKA